MLCLLFESKHKCDYWIMCTCQNSVQNKVWDVPWLNLLLACLPQISYLKFSFHPVQVMALSLSCSDSNSWATNLREKIYHYAMFLLTCDSQLHWKHTSWFSLSATYLFPFFFNIFQKFQNFTSQFLPPSAQILCISSFPFSQSVGYYPSWSPTCHILRVSFPPSSHCFFLFIGVGLRFHGHLFFLSCFLEQSLLFLPPQ